MKITKATMVEYTAELACVRGILINLHKASLHTPLVAKLFYLNEEGDKNILQGEILWERLSQYHTIIIIF